MNDLFVFYDEPIVESSLKQQNARLNTMKKVKEPMKHSMKSMINELDSSSSPVPVTTRSAMMQDMLNMLEMIDSDEPVTIGRFMSEDMTEDLIEGTFTEFRKSSPHSPNTSFGRFSDMLMHLENEEIKQQEHGSAREDEIIYALSESKSNSVKPSPPRRLNHIETLPPKISLDSPARTIAIEKPKPSIIVEPQSIALSLWRQALGRHLTITRSEVSPGTLIPLFSPPPPPPTPSNRLSSMGPLLSKNEPSVAPFRLSSLPSVELPSNVSIEHDLSAQAVRRISPLSSLKDPINIDDLSYLSPSKRNSSMPGLLNQPEASPNEKHIIPNTIREYSVGELPEEENCQESADGDDTVLVESIISKVVMIVPGGRSIPLMQIGPSKILESSSTENQIILNGMTESYADELTDTLNEYIMVPNDCHENGQDHVVGNDTFLSAPVAEDDKPVEYLVVPARGNESVFIRQRKSSLTAVVNVKDISHTQLITPLAISPGISETSQPVEIAPAKEDPPTNDHLESPERIVVSVRMETPKTRGKNVPYVIPREKRLMLVSGGRTIPVAPTVRPSTPPADKDMEEISSGLLEPMPTDDGTGTDKQAPVQKKTKKLKGILRKRVQVQEEVPTVKIYL